MRGAGAAGVSCEACAADSLMARPYGPRGRTSKRRRSGGADVSALASVADDSLGAYSSGWRSVNSAMLACAGACSAAGAARWRAAGLAGAVSTGAAGASLVTTSAVVARVARRRVGATGVSLAAGWALVISSCWAAVAAGVALRRARVARRGCAVSPVVASSARVKGRAVACAEVSAPVGAACACCAVTFRVRVVRRGGRMVS